MFKDLYKTSIVDSLMNELGYNNVMQVPHLVKVCVNIGIGVRGMDDKVMKYCTESLKVIASQLPVVTYAKKSIANFKVRKGYPIGCKVTLRKDKMYEFLEKTVYAVLTTEKDFNGLSIKNFDGNGNISFGIKEHISCLEIDYDKVEQMLGFDVTIVTSAVDNYSAKKLLLAFGFPFID